MRKVAINYCTFARDLEWTDVSLRSFRKYASGFSAVTIVVPTVDVEKFLPFERRYSTPECPVLIKNFLEYPGKGFVHHLAMKCYADVFQPDATHILHFDPDCIWTSPVTPDDYFVDGKPVLLIESYELLRQYFENRAYWKNGVDEALRIDAKFETMCRHPAVHIPEVYRKLRSRVEQFHMTPFIDYVTKQKNSFPQSFAEFPSLGAVALEWFSDKYHFIDVTEARRNRLSELIHGDRDARIGHPPSKALQMWSYQGVNSKENREQIAKYL